MVYILKPLLEIFVLYAPTYNGTYLVPFGILTRVYSTSLLLVCACCLRYSQHIAHSCTLK